MNVKNTPIKNWCLFRVHCLLILLGTDAVVQVQNFPVKATVTDQTDETVIDANVKLIENTCCYLNSCPWRRVNYSKLFTYKINIWKTVFLLIK